MWFRDMGCYKDLGGKMGNEVPSVLWSLWTTPNMLTGFTPFFMVYGVEAVLPTDLLYGSPRVRAYQPDTTEGGPKGCHRPI
jgi:hypothetical protein